LCRRRGRYPAFQTDGTRLIGVRRTNCTYRSRRNQ
jgi:hypothetical protein